MITINNLLKIISFSAFLFFFTFIELLTAGKLTDSSASINDEDISFRLIFIGDAGEPSKDSKEPVLVALEEEVLLNPENTFVIYLGDNIYPDGLLAECDPSREESEGYIDEQINIILRSGAKGLFIPGNHDWGNGADDGWERINRQEVYINSKNSLDLFFLPSKGCPGPDVIDINTSIRIIALDTQWWLQDVNNRPEREDSICKYCTEQEIITALDSILQQSQNRINIIAAHHPLSTHGPHGGHFTWKDHIFPLTVLNDYLWFPLPIVGSLYPLVRMSGISEQDLTSDEYQNLKKSIETVLSKYSNIIYASGHEHAIQILNGISQNIYIVSGAGIWGHIEDSIGIGDDTIFAGAFEGFVIVDFQLDGSIKLSVIQVINELGDKEEVFNYSFTN